MKAEQSVFASGLTNLKTLNVALLSTSTLLMEDNQYRFLPRTSIRQTLNKASRESTPPIYFSYSVMRSGWLILMWFLEELSQRFTVVRGKPAWIFEITVTGPLSFQQITPIVFFS